MQRVMYDHRPHRCLFAVLSVSLLGLFVSVAGTVASTQPDASEEIRAAIAISGEEFPAVVAIANGQEISGQALARRIYAITHSPALVGSDAVRQDPLAVALDQLVGEKVLLDAADVLGLVSTTDDAKAFAQEQWQFAVSSNDPQALEAFEIAAEQFGVAPEEFMTQPEAVEAYRTALTRGNMYQYIRSQLPDDQRLDPEAFREALTAFVIRNTEQVEILISR